MSGLENLPEGVQLQIRTNAILMALKKTLIATPELHKAFQANYNEEIKSCLNSLEADQ